MSIVADIKRVMPSSVQHKVHDLRERESSFRWDCGDVVNEAYAYVVANALPYTKLEVCGWISLELDSDRAPNTLLEYARVASFFSEAIREKFAELPFSHFQLAMAYGKDWRKVIKKSRDLAVEGGGKPPSKARLERELTGAPMPEPPPFVYPSSMPNATIVVAAPDELGEVRSLLTQLQVHLEHIQRQYPGIAPLVAQAVLIIQEALTHAIEKQSVVTDFDSA